MCDSRGVLRGPFRRSSPHPGTDPLRALNSVGPGRASIPHSVFVLYISSMLPRSLLLRAAVAGIVSACTPEPGGAVVAPVGTATVDPPPPATVVVKPAATAAPTASTMPTTMESAPPASGSGHSCKGMNDCKGQGGCKTTQHACKGMNDCKGQGGCKV
jgi:hypothetical protein